MELAGDSIDKTDVLLSEPLQLPCPNCGQGLPASLQDIKDLNTLNCQGCGREIELFRG